jgi:hypothetical protein
MARIDIRSNGGGGSVATGVLQLQGGVAMTSTLTAVTDQNNTTSPLKLSTTAVQVVSPFRITTDDPSDMYLDCEDGSANNRFNITRNTASQQVNLNFASNPAGSTTIVGAVRTYVDGVNLSEVMSFREDGRVGVGTTTPQAKLDVRTTDGLSSAQLCSNNDSSLPLRLFRANNGLVGINTLSSGGTIDSPSDRASLGAITRLTGNAYVDGAYRGLARMEYYLDAIPTAGVAPCSIRFLTVDSSSSTYSLNERMGITSDGNLQINDSIVNNRNAKLFIKGSGSTSATTSLLVQNSLGNNILQIGDSGLAEFGNTGGGGGGGVNAGVFRGTYFNSFGDAFTIFETSNSTGNAYFYQNVSIGSGVTPVASAALDVVSTTKGFLPPRMTTAQKNAIATPAAGLMVYDTNLNKLCVYTTAWETITSL